MTSDSISNKLFKSPRLSIITINYNNAVGLEKTLESIFHRQSFLNFESIVIDGGSTDGSIEVLKKFQDKITYWKSEPDNGIYNAMNKGIVLAKGEYLNFMNSGDCFSNDILAFVFNSNPKFDIIYGNCNCYSPNDSFIKIHPSGLTFQFLIENTITHQCLFIKTELQKKYLYDDTLKIVADWKFLMETFLDHTLEYQYLNKTICKYELSGISAKLVNLRKYERQLVMKQLLPENIYSDLIILARIYKSPFLQACLQIDKTAYFKKIIYALIYPLIRIYVLIKK